MHILCPRRRRLSVTTARTRNSLLCDLLFLLAGHLVCLVSTPSSFFFVFIAELVVSLLVLPLLIIRFEEATGLVAPPN